MRLSRKDLLVLAAIIIGMTPLVARVFQAVGAQP